MERLKHHPRAGRSQSVDGGQDAQCWIGHEPAKLFQIIHEDDADKEFVHPEEVNHVTEQINCPVSVCSEKRDSLGAVYRHDCPHIAKTVEVATGAVHPECAAEH